MVAITDPEAIRFVNEQIRPLCEEVRALVARVGAMNTSWQAGINVKFPNDASAVTDNRDTEGISRLTGADIQSAVGILLAVTAASNSQIISKPCVRALSAS